MCVHYLGSRNKKIGSRLIAWGSSLLFPKMKKVPSHVAILVDERWVLESTLFSGTRVYPYKKWKEINEELYKIECINHFGHKNVFKEFRAIKGKKYDYAGLIYFGYRIFLNTAFNIPIPTKNRWNNKNRFFCSEVIGSLTSRNYEMKTPAGVIDDLLKGIN